MSKLTVCVEQDPNRFDPRTGLPLPERQAAVWVKDGTDHVALMCYGATDKPATACLFAAAPEMLTILKEIHAWMDAEVSGWDAKFIKEVGAVIAKATEGES